MSTFVVTRKSDGAEVYRYAAQLPIEWTGYEFETHAHSVVPEAAPEAAPEVDRSWSAFDFMRRFTANERIAARIRAKSDPVLEDFFALLNSATSVRSDDADVVAGLNYLAAVGILSTGRVNEILRGA